jgi:hypothetical protein
VDGVHLVTPVTSIPLDGVREDVRQVAIAIAKLAIAYANGVELSRPRVSKSESGEEKKLPSLLSEFESLIRRFKPIPNGKDTQST